MLVTRSDGGEWSLSLGAEVVLTGSPARPFAEMIRREKRYSANRGTVKTEIVESERVPLTEFCQEPDGSLRFTGGGHSLRAVPRQVGPDLRQ